MFQFDNTYINLPQKFFEKVTPASVSNPKLLAFNKELANKFQAPTEYLEQKLASFFSGKTLFDGAQPIAVAYAGHQFGHFVPQLGDGRALLLGEIIDSVGGRYDMQLKGSGQTPFSRGGDGKSPLGPVIREYILSEAMHHLGVPTTRALAAVSTGDPVYRQEVLPGAIFTRIASSHIRIGTFEYFAARNDVDAIKNLADYSINRHYPNIEGSDNVYLEFFEKVIEAQTSLVMQWMALGFIHGVMNTDNTSIAGETIDYGPCAFMDTFEFHKVFSSIDRQGRYSYGNQTSIVLWNLCRLADCLVALVDSDSKVAISKLEEKLTTVQEGLDDRLTQKMATKLGIIESIPEDRALVETWLQYLQKHKLDYTLSFRELSKLLDVGSRAGEMFFETTPEFEEFVNSWRKRLAQQDHGLAQVKKQMEAVNPVFIPRNHQVERAIKHALDGDLSVFEEMNKVSIKPYVEQPEFDIYKKAPLPQEIVNATFCGT